MPVEPVEVEEPLELQVVDGVDRADGPIPLVDAVLGPEQHAQQPALPVVAVEDVREETDPGQGLQDGPAEEGEAVALVLIAGVDPIPTEEGQVVHEVIPDPVLHHGVDAAVEPIPAHEHGEVRHMLHGADVGIGDQPIFGQDHPHVETLLVEGHGQGAHHVRKAAGLDEGHGLAGAQEHLQRPLLDHGLRLGDDLFDHRLPFGGRGPLHGFCSAHTV